MSATCIIAVAGGLVLAAALGVLLGVVSGRRQAVEAINLGVQKPSTKEVYVTRNEEGEELLREVAELLRKRGSDGFKILEK